MTPPAMAWRALEPVRDQVVVATKFGFATRSTWNA